MSVLTGVFDDHRGSIFDGFRDKFATVVRAAGQYKGPAAAAMLGVTMSACATAPDTTIRQDGSVYGRGQLELPANCRVISRQSGDVRSDGTIDARPAPNGAVIRCVGDSNPRRRETALEKNLRTADRVLRSGDNILRRVERLENTLGRLGF